MADVRIRDGALRVVLTTAERLMALRRRDIVVPLANVSSVVAVPDATAQLRGLRAPGAGFPGRLAIGTWRGSAAAS